MNRSEACLGGGAYADNEWRLVKIGRWMEYTCGVISETNKLDRIVPLWCTLISFLSEEMLSCILRVSLEYASYISGHDTSTWYHFECLSIPGWLDIFCAGPVPVESRSWQRFSCRIDWKWFNIVDSVNIHNSILIVVSGMPEIDTYQIIWIVLGGSSTPENGSLVRIYRYHNSTQTILDEDGQLRRILTREDMAPRNLT